MQVLSTSKSLIGIAVVIIVMLMGFAVMGQETEETTTPTSLSNVTNQPIHSTTPTSQSAIENEAILTSPTPTSLSNTTNLPIFTTTPTSQSAVQDELITTNTAISQTLTAPPQATFTETIIQAGVDEMNSTPFASELIDYQTSMFNPGGRNVFQTRNLTMVLIAMGTLVYLYVMALLFITMLRRNSDAELGDDRQERGVGFVIANGIVFAPTILVVVFALTLFVMVTINPTGTNSDLQIEVNGKQWWWEIEYPQHDFATANELHIPVGQDIEITLLSDNVIHSFWVPELSFKVDLVPGRENVLRLEATEPGVYRGRCAEFCGAQHTNMQFLVIVQSQADFDIWISQQQQAASEPADDIIAQGQDAFFSAGCRTCHTIRGTNATGELGPDLTHLASRRTIASGMLPNTRGHLAGWVIAPQDIKPGSLMPDQEIPSDDLQALLTYLQSLQ